MYVVVQLPDEGRAAWAKLEHFIVFRLNEACRQSLRHDTGETGQIGTRHGGARNKLTDIVQDDKIGQGDFGQSARERRRRGRVGLRLG